MKRQVKITDHAVLRYLERVCELDIEKLRAQLVQQLDGAARMGASIVNIDQHSYRIVDGVCVTVVPRTSTAKPGRKRHYERRQREGDQ